MIISTFVLTFTNIVSHNRKWCKMVGADESKISHELDFFTSLIHEDDISSQVNYLSKTIDDFKNFIKNDKKKKNTTS